MMGHDDARHLVSRTGIGTPPAEIAALAQMTRGKAVDALLRGVRSAPTTTKPSWASEPMRPREVLVAAMSDPKAVQEMLRERGFELKQWWFGEMLETPSPLTERMTLFWHNHFTSGLRKVRRPALMLRQNLMLRAGALGRFDDLLRAVLHDPAMLVYLDNVRNHANEPNENLGRELLELFTLGEGQYEEADVKAAARSLTGWGVNRRTGEFRAAPWKHDTGEKTLLGKTGRFDGDQMVPVILGHTACAPYIAAKLRGEFITTAAAPAELAHLAARFREDWDIAALVAAVLKSDAFWAPDNRATRIKSPVELLVGTIRTLRLRIPGERVLVQSSRALGQDVFEPPNVKGWAGGDAWITSNSLLRRMAILDRAGRFETKIEDLDQWLGKAFAGRPQAERIQRILLAADPLTAPPTRDVRTHVRGLLSDPIYQLG